MTTTAAAASASVSEHSPPQDDVIPMQEDTDSVSLNQVSPYTPTRPLPSPTPTEPPPATTAALPLGTSSPDAPAKSDDDGRHDDKPRNEELAQESSPMRQQSYSPTPSDEHQHEENQANQSQDQQKQQPRQQQQQPQQTSPSSTPPTTPSPLHSLLPPLSPQEFIKLQQQQNSSNQSQQQSSNEQKRPMNAFLLFCKRQRSLVREKYPNLENRGITKILGDWWSKLDKEQKSKYTDLARQHKDAFMKANPDFKWCKTPVSVPNNSTTTTNNNNSTNNNNNNNNSNTSNNNIINNVFMNDVNNPNAIATAASIAAGITNHNHHRMDNNSINDSNDCYTATNHHKAMNSLSSLRTMAHLDIVQTQETRDLKFKNRLQQPQQQLNEAPKPPKKRFLERNDSVYTSASSATTSTSATRHNNSTTNNNESSSRAKDSIVPYISLDQATLDRVIDEAFSEKSNKSPPSGSNMCKRPNNRIPTSSTTNLTSATTAISSASHLAGLQSSNQATFSATTTQTSSATNFTRAPYATNTNVDEPVDFSMNRTFTATRQQIINNLVDNLLSTPADGFCGASKMDSSDDNSQAGLMTREGVEET